jgi:hypothetical protein
MKKLAALMTAAMCMTVGGVYAAWSYATNDIIGTAVGSTAIGLTSIENPTQKGAIKVVIANGVTIAVDQDTTNETDIHTAKLIFSGNPVATFTPAKGASVSSIDMKIQISIQSKTNDYKKLNGTLVEDVFYLEGANGDGVVEYVVGSEVDNDGALAGQQVNIDLSQYLKIKPLVLGTAEEHGNFNTWLDQEAIKVVITLSEAEESPDAV